MTEDVGKLRGLNEAQKAFVLKSRKYPCHPYDIGSSTSTARAMVRRGLAYLAVCHVVTGGEFNGYGLTEDGLAVRSRLLERKTHG